MSHFLFWYFEEELFTVKKASKEEPNDKSQDRVNLHDCPSVMEKMALQHLYFGGE